MDLFPDDAFPNDTPEDKGKSKKFNIGKINGSLAYWKGVGA